MAHAFLYEDDAGFTELVRFDILKVETHEAPTDVTEYPVEEGSDISDNARPGVKKLQIEGFVSNKPLLRNLKDAQQVDIASFLPLQIQSKQVLPAGTRSQILDLPEKQSGLPLGPGAVTQAIYGFIDSLSGPVSATLARYRVQTDNWTVRTLQQPSPVDRIVEMQEKLNDIWENSRICRVVTSLEHYDDMIIENRVSRRSVDDGSGATFSFELKKIKFVTSDIIAAPNPIVKKSMGSRNVQETKNETLYLTKIEEQRALYPDLPLEYLPAYSEVPAPEFL